MEEILPAETNIVIFKLNSSLSVSDFLSKIELQNVMATQFGHQAIRMVTHLDITDEMTEKIKNALNSI